jgi:hypothetical protein
MARVAPGHDRKLWARVAVTYGYVFLWIGLSAGVILYNKWLLAYGGFPYPVALTMWHMAFCAALAWCIIRAGWVEGVQMNAETYLRTIVPISALYAGTLWLGNAAYIYLSVSFIQMLKASMPMAVFTVGCMFGTEHFSTGRLANMLVIAVGICIASYGEINFVVVGVMLQMASVATESTRLTLVQILLQRRGIKLNPITTLYLIAPCCFAFLCVPFVSSGLVHLSGPVHRYPVLPLHACWQCRERMRSTAVLCLQCRVPPSAASRPLTNPPSGVYPCRRCFSSCPKS